MSFDGQRSAIEDDVGIQCAGHADGGLHVGTEGDVIEARRAAGEGRQQDGALREALGGGKGSFALKQDFRIRQQVVPAGLPRGGSVAPGRRHEEEGRPFFKGLEARSAAGFAHREGEQAFGLEMVIEREHRFGIFRRAGRRDDLNDVGTFLPGLFGHGQQPLQRVGRIVIVVGHDDAASPVQGQVPEPGAGGFREVDRDVDVVGARKDGGSQHPGGLFYLRGQGDMERGNQLRLLFRGKQVPDVVFVEVAGIQPDFHGGA